MNPTSSMVIRNQLQECCDEIRILEELIENARRRYWMLRMEHSPLTWRQWFWIKLGWY